MAMIRSGAGLDCKVGNGKFVTASSLGAGDIFMLPESLEVFMLVQRGEGRVLKVNLKKGRASAIGPYASVLPLKQVQQAEFQIA